MFYKGFLKRIIPFFLTFTAGLLIASIFVPLSFQNWKMPNRSSHKHREIQRLRTELTESRRENSELKNEIKELKQNVHTEFDVYEGVPPVAIEAPHPPAPPRAPRAPRYDR